MMYVVREPEFLTIAASGKLTRDDYAAMIPRLEQELEERSEPLRLLVRLSGFRGWTPDALVEDLRFDLRHREDIERIAVVGERPIERIGTELSKPLFTGEVCFFRDEDEARAWLKEPASALAKDRKSRAPLTAKLVAGGFLLLGAAKIAQVDTVKKSFAEWGFSQRFMTLVGLAEVAGAIGLLIPAVRRPAAFGLSALMGGAIATHVCNHESPMALPALGTLFATARLASPPA